MSCDVTRGRKEACKEQNGGVKAIYLVNYTAGLLDSATFDATDDDITAFNSALTLFKYETRGNTDNLEQVSETSGDNGTNFTTQTLTVNLRKLTKEDRKEFKLLKAQSPHIVVEDYNGNYLMMGIENGCDVNITSSTGSARGDLSGYTITATATEKNEAHFIDPTIIDDTTNTSVTEGSLP